MKRDRIVFGSLLAGAILAMAMAGSAAAMEVGIGQSDSKDAKTAGAEAAAQAKAALGEQEAKLVLVYHGPDLFDDAAKLLEGIASVFDSSIVYGCNSYAPLTHQGGQPQVGVLALAGDLRVTAAAAETAGKDDDLACGKRLGDSLKEAAGAEAAGRVLLLFGDCHVPRNDTVVKGVAGVLGDDLPVIGGAAFRGRSYFQGKIVQGTNIGILLSGDFKCRLALLQDNSPEGLITSARDAFRKTVGDDPDKVALTFVFDCGGRRGKMLKLGNVDQELEAMKEVAGDTPIFGFYGSGEIGCTSNDAAPCGVGYHISACAILGE